MFYICKTPKTPHMYYMFIAKSYLFNLTYMYFIVQFFLMPFICANKDIINSHVWHNFGMTQ